MGFIADSGIIRPPCKIYDDKNEEIGEVTSGTYSPILKKGIGLAFIKNDLAKVLIILFFKKKKLSYM